MLAHLIRLAAAALLAATLAPPAMAQVADLPVVTPVIACADLARTDLSAIGVASIRTT